MCISIYVATLVAANISIASGDFRKLLGGWLRVVADVGVCLALVAIVPRHMTTAVAGTFRYDAIVSSREGSSRFDTPMPTVRAMMTRAQNGGLGSRF